MGRVFHIGVGDDGNYAVDRMTEIAAAPKAGLSGQFGKGFDEGFRRAAVYDMAMTNFPEPTNKI